MSTMRRNPTTGEYEFVPDGRNLFGGLGGINPERPQGNEPAITDKKLGDRYLPPEPNSMGGPTSEGRFVGPDHPLYDTLPSGGGNTMIPLQGVDAERLKRQRGYYERGPDALGSNVYTGDTGSRLLLPAEDRPIIEDIAPISDVDVRDLPPPVMPTPVMPTPVMPTPFVPPPVMPTYDGSTISPMVSTPTMPTYDGSFPVMDREPFVMDRVPREVRPREVMDPLVMDPLVMDPAPLQPQPIASPAPSALNIGAGMSANDLQRMLARRSVGPTNLNEVNSSILSLQQAEVANRARRANVPPQRPYEPPPTGPSSPYGTPLTGPSSPYGPGSPYGPYGPPPTGPGSPYGPPPTGPGSPYGPYGREVQPYGREVQPTSYGIGSFGQPMQQQGFGSNKPTANVLF